MRFDLKSKNNLVVFNFTMVSLYSVALYSMYLVTAGIYSLYYTFALSIILLLHLLLLVIFIVISIIKRKTELRNECLISLLVVCGTFSIIYYITGKIDEQMHFSRESTAQNLSADQSVLLSYFN